MRRAALLALLLAAPSAAHAAVAPSQRVVFGFPTSSNIGIGGTLTLTTMRGPFKPVATARYEKDLVTAAHADSRGVSYTISPKAYWYWGGRKVPVTWRDFAYTVQTYDDAGEGFQPYSGLANIDPNHIVHQGLRKVAFFWRTSGCSDTMPCGAYTNWQSLFDPLLPSFALSHPNANTLWTNCLCGDDGKPISDGPFYMARYNPTTDLAVLERNPYWGGRRPALAEIDLRAAIDYADALRSGAIDVYSDRADASVEPLLHTPGITVQWGTLPVAELLWFRLGDERGGPGVTKGSSNALLRAPWMRQAIALALDRRAIVTTLFGSFARYTPPMDNLLVFPFGAGYHRDFARWSYDPAKALALLKAHCVAGTGPSAPDPSTTKTWECAGLPAKFRWTWKAEAPLRTTTEELARSELQAVGIQIVPQPLPGSVIYTPSGAGSGDFDILDLSVDTSGDPADLVDAYRCGGLDNWTGFCSKKVDALLTAAGREFEAGSRIEDYATADKILSESVPAFPLYAPPHALARKSTLLGVGAGPALLFENWHWRR